jgi:hypothetical protein
MNADQDKELMKMWQESVLPAPVDTWHMAKKLVERGERFGRTIFWRNMREYVAGVGLIAWLLWNLRAPGQRFLSVTGIVATGFVMFYLWRGQREKQPVDASSDMRAYQAALLERYDRQIALLRRVKYWYVAPFYAWMLLVLLMVPAPPARKIPYFIFFTSFSGIAVWLNESYGVRKLRKARGEVESMLGENDEQDR